MWLSVLQYSVNYLVKKNHSLASNLTFGIPFC